MPSTTAGQIIRYIQWALYSGKQPDADGYYRFSRKELYEGCHVAATTFDKNRSDVEDYFGKWCNLVNQGNYSEYAREMLYVDVKYDKGIFMFKRNPITLSPELQHLWAAPPLEDYFVYDAYDKKHRRRTNGSPKYDAYPWSWSEEQIQEAQNASRICQVPVTPYCEKLQEQKRKKTDEEKRIESIRHNGGRHLRNFKSENITYDMCLVAVADDGFAIHYVPEHYRTQEIYLLACKTYGGCLSRVPEAYISLEMCRYAVSSDGGIIGCVPERFRTLEIYLAAATNNPIIMQRIPTELLTPDFCVAVAKGYGLEAIGSLPKTHKNSKFYLELVKRYPELLSRIPKNGRTASVCSTAIKVMGYKSMAEAIIANKGLFFLLPTALYDHETCLAFAKEEFGKKNSNREENRDLQNHVHLQHVYEDEISLKHLLRWPDVCEIVIQKLPLSLSYVDPRIITYDLCLKAVSLCHRAFYNVPVQFKTRELCMIAFNQEPHYLKEIPEEFITYDLCLDAVNRSGYVLSDVPCQFRDRVVYLAAVRGVGHMIEEVPEEFLDEEICLAAFNDPQRSYGNLSRIPARFRTYRVCLRAAERDSGCMKHIPPELITYDVCLASVKHGNIRIGILPDEYYTEELCIALLKSSDVAFADIPKKSLTEKMCLLALSHATRYSHSVLAEIPDELITQEMCTLAVNKTVWALNAVPERYVTEDMLMKVASEAPGRLADNFPVRFRTECFIETLVSRNPAAARYVQSLLTQKND